MLGKNTLRALRFAQGQADRMQDALPLRRFGEPQGGVGPSYEGMYNEESRDTEKRNANPRGSGTNRFGTGMGGRMY